MPVYPYICRTCGTEMDAIHSIAEHDTYNPGNCPRCRTPFYRRYDDVQFAPVTHERFDQTLGVPISDNKQFTSELARKQDEMSERLGFDQKFTVADPNDKTHLGVIDE